MNNQMRLILELKDELRELKMLNEAIERTNDIWSKKLHNMQRRCEQCKSEKQS